MTIYKHLVYQAPREGMLPPPIPDPLLLHPHLFSKVLRMEHTHWMPKASKQSLGNKVPGFMK